MKNSAIPVAPRVVPLVIPEGVASGGTFVVGVEVTGAAEPLHVRVPEGMAAGQPLEVSVPEDAAVSLALQQAPQATDVAHAWAEPVGMDFYSVAQQAGFQITVGALEVTVCVEEE